MVKPKVKAKGTSLSVKMKLVNKLGLHLRAAAVFIKTANMFTSDVRLEHGSKKVNGKSIMGLMALAAPYGSELVLKVKGEDAKQAMEQLTKLVANRFGEHE